MSQPPSANATVPALPPQRLDGPGWLDVVVIAALTATIAFHFRGHFVKPQSDFHEFAGTGRQLIRGELPRTFKRAPLFPVIVAGGGAFLRSVSNVEAPEQVFAEWFNAGLAPLNAVLVYLIGRRWFGRGARWVAVWSVLAPWAVWSAANALVETPLVCAVLLTIWLAQRGSRWAYAAAAAAMILRYDVAGLLPGLVLWDLLRRTSWWRVLLCAVAAAAPTAIWQALTAIYWNPADGSHYIAQIQERPIFQLAWSVGVTFYFLLEPAKFAFPAILSELGGPAVLFVTVSLIGSAAVGTLVLLLQRGRAGLVLLGCYAGYVVVHAVFPFREARFAHPPMPLVQLAAGAGIAAIVAALRGPRAARAATALAGAASAAVVRTIGGIALALAALVVGLALYGELLDLRSAVGAAARMALFLTVVAVGGILALWIAGPWRGQKVVSRCVLLAALLLGARLHARAIAPHMGTGREMANLVEAARWVRDQAQPGERVVSTFPGLIQMYAGYEPRGRFIGFDRLKAPTWREVLDECRANGVVYLIWHDLVFPEAGDYYIQAWGLQRFEPLNTLRESMVPPGVRVERTFLDHPNLWIVRVKDAPASRPATAPSANPSGGPR